MAMTQVSNAPLRSDVPTGLSGDGGDAVRALISDASSAGVLDVGRLADWLAGLQAIAPEQAQAFRSEVELLLTPVQVGELRAATTQIEANANATRPGDVTADQLRQIMPNAGAQAELYVEPLNRAMEANGITTPERRAAFLAQVSVESGDLRQTVENLNYSERRLTQVWPRRFPTEAAALPYARDPEALANRVYANRLGNGDEASGDGWNFRGRGLMQVTGRSNYRAVGYEDNPALLAQPGPASDTAARFWSDNGLNTASDATLDRAAFDAISRRVNGGNHGINERWSAYQRALSALTPQQ